MSLCENDEAESSLHSVDRLLPYDIIKVTDNQAKRFSNGVKLSFDRLNCEITEDLCYRVKYKDNFIGIGFADKENKEIRIKCLINPIKED